ncbi:MAG TPA: hypothetical protein GX707_07590 [Epulopiscium sp.]|nr:hypothetical protein [Candidatus Epulonipiscium sp.]
MNDFNSTALPCISFARIYENNIESRIKEIDIFLKSTPSPYTPEDISDLLHIDLNDLMSIMENKNITILNILSFFTIVQSSTSYICQLIQREWQYNGIPYYTPEIIAYIYDLNLDKVRLAFEQSGLSHIDPNNIKELFNYIYIPVMNF